MKKKNQCEIFSRFLFYSRASKWLNSCPHALSRNPIERENLKWVACVLGNVKSKRVIIGLWVWVRGEGESGNVAHTHK